jgi:hypothetical protein
MERIFRRIIMLLIAAWWWSFRRKVKKWAKSNRIPKGENGIMKTTLKIKGVNVGLQFCEGFGPVAARMSFDELKEIAPAKDARTTVTEFNYGIDEYEHELEMSEQETTETYGFIRGNDTEIRKGLKWAFEGIGNFVAPELKKWSDLGLNLATAANSPVDDKIENAVRDAKRVWEREAEDKASDLRRAEFERKQEIRQAVDTAVLEARMKWEASSGHQ